MTDEKVKPKKYVPRIKSIGPGSTKEEESAFWKQEAEYAKSANTVSSARQNTKAEKVKPKWHAPVKIGRGTVVHKRIGPGQTECGLGSSLLWHNEILMPEGTPITCKKCRTPQGRVRAVRPNREASE